MGHRLLKCLRVGAGFLTYLFACFAFFCTFPALHVAVNERFPAPVSCRNTRAFMHQTSLKKEKSTALNMHMQHKTIA